MNAVNVDSLSRDEALVLLKNYRNSAVVGQKHDPFAGTPTGPYSHGQFGLFNMPGSLPSIYSAITKGESLAEDLPIVQGIFNVPGYNAEVGMSTLVTGVTSGEADSWSNQPTAACAEPPSGGLLKLCTMVFPYGKVWGGTEKLDITEVGSVVHRDEPVGFQLMNNPMQNSPLVPANPMAGSNLEIELYRRTWLSLFTLTRLVNQLVWTATPANNTNNAKQWVGMQIQINQNNKRDAFTGQICTAANSVVFDANYLSVDDDPVGVYRLFEETYRHVKYNARQSGLEPVMWKLVVQEDLFKKLTRSVPVTEHLHSLVTMVRSAEFTSGRINIDASSATELGHRMYRERFLPLDGDMVSVVCDTYIPEDDITTNGNLQAGEFSSDAYFIPYTVLGGIPVTGWDFKSWNNADLNAIASQFRYPTYQTMDGGRSLWFNLEQLGCVQTAYVIAPRLVCFTPQVAGRIQNVAYTPILHVRSWNPDSQYFHDGGRTNSPSDSFYNSWSSTPAVIGVRT